MAGIYIHIPFCRRACTYCNFHFSTQLSGLQDLLGALHRELELKKHYLKGIPIHTIYFGGGTPSLLTASEIQTLLTHITDCFAVDPNAEVTLEANPDDLTSLYISQLKSTLVNRLSIGIQSFFEQDMSYMHRIHTPKQSIEAVQNSQRAGFNNITIDLIYGVPGSDLNHWTKNLDQAFELQVQHLSCYALTVEPKTVLARHIEMNKTQAPDDRATISQFDYLLNTAPAHGFEPYEISNYAKPGFRSRHNSSYWQGTPYIGLGPSAHSYNHDTRQWNIANNRAYIQAIDQGLPYYETEVLDDNIRYNEFILTRIRTSEGIRHLEIPTPYLEHFNRQIVPWLAQKYLVHKEGAYILTKEGKFIADRISADLFT